MLKKLTSLMLCLLLLLQVIPETRAAQKDETTRTVNELLQGLSFYPEQMARETADWPEETVASMIYGKLMDIFWEPDASVAQRLGLESWNDNKGYLHYDLDAIDRLTQDVLGRDFPRDVKHTSLEIFGGELLFTPAIGEFTELSVQYVFQKGNTLTALGTAVHHYAPYTEFLGFFRAVCRKNPSSVYGYTLVSLEEIGGAQGLDNVTATASSELAEYGLTHTADRVVDGDLGTAWVEGVSGVGTGEWITLRTTGGTKIQLSAISFLMGYHKSQELLDRNGWPSQIRIECEGGFSQDAYIYGALLGDFHTILLDQAVETEWVTITILDAEAGTRYEDTCISEIRLLSMDKDAFFPDVSEAPTEPSTQPAPSTEAETQAPTEATELEATEPSEEAAAPAVWLWAAGGAALTAVCAVTAVVTILLLRKTRHRR